VEVIAKETEVQDALKHKLFENSFITGIGMGVAAHFEQAVPTRDEDAVRRGKDCESVLMRICPGSLFCILFMSLIFGLVTR
jgi:hypothetical protein